MGRSAANQRLKVRKAKDREARQAAIDDGKTQYTRPSNGKLYIIRNLGNAKHKSNYGGQGGRDELHSSRNRNRGSGRRSIYEDMVTHPALKRTFYEIKARANRLGLDADHTRDLARVARGMVGLPQRTRLKKLTTWVNAKLPTGSVAKNTSMMTPEKNQIVKNADQQDLDNHLGAKEKANPSNGSKLGNGTQIFGRNGKNGRNGRNGTVRMPRTWMPVQTQGQLLKALGKKNLMPTNSSQMLQQRLEQNVNNRQALPAPRIGLV